MRLSRLLPHTAPSGQPAASSTFWTRKINGLFGKEDPSTFKEQLDIHESGMSTSFPLDQTKDLD